MVTVTPQDNLADAIESASTGETVVATSGEHILTRSGIQWPGAVELHLKSGAVVKTGVRHGTHEKMFVLDGVNNCALTGPGVIDGNHENFDHADSQWGHMLFLNDVSGFLLDGPTLQNAPAGDCLYIRDTHDSEFRNFVAHGGYRNSVSLINGTNLLFRDGRCSGAYGTLPKSGFDIEPNDPSDVDNVRIHNIVFRDNAVEGFKFVTHHADDSTTVRVDVTACESVNNGHNGVRQDGKSLDLVRYDGFVARQNGRKGFHLEGQNTYLWDCVAENNGSNYRAFYCVADNPQGVTVGMKGCRAVGGSFPVSILNDEAVHPELTLLEFSQSGNQTSAIEVGPECEVIHDGGYSFTGGGTVTHISERPEKRDWPARPQALDGGNGGDGTNGGSDGGGDSTQESGLDVAQLGMMLGLAGVIRKLTGE